MLSGERKVLVLLLGLVEEWDPNRIAEVGRQVGKGSKSGNTELTFGPMKNISSEGKMTRQGNNFPCLCQGL